MANSTAAEQQQRYVLTASAAAGLRLDIRM
jgi:hypothetical protein